MKLDLKLKVGKTEFTRVEILNSEIALNFVIQQAKLRLQHADLCKWEKEFLHEKIGILETVKRKLSTLLKELGNEKLEEKG